MIDRDLRTPYESVIGDTHRIQLNETTNNDKIDDLTLRSRDEGLSFVSSSDFLLKFQLDSLENMYKTRNPNGDINKYKDIMDLINTFCISKSGPWVGGGLVLDILMNRDNINDIDVFFRNKTMIEETSIHFYLSLSLIGAKIQNKFMSKCATNFIVKYNDNTYKIQFITHSVFSNILELLNQFDMQPCKFGLYEKNKIIFDSRAKLALDTKKIDGICRKTTNAYNIKRMLRYANKGFTFSDSCINQVATGLLLNRNNILLNSSTDDAFGYNQIGDEDIPF